MEKIRIKEDELYNISPILKGIMNLAFDESCIMDKDGYIVHCSESSPLIWGCPNEESIGKHITELDSASPYPELLKTGKAVMGKIHIINGMTCITHMIPLFSEDDRIIGAFGVIIFRGTEKIKKLVREKYIDGDKSSEIYNQLSRAEAKYSIMDFIGQSRGVREALEMAKKAAKYSYPVLIRGETGCGKEILACGIHAESARDEQKPFIRINCTAIPHDLLESELFGYEKGAFTGAYSTKQGKFEIAAGGTILLDEIGDISASMQSKLLRVIEEREFERLGGNKLIPLHARIIASTNSDLERLIDEGRFRQDLYYRLSGIEITIPPLRRRREDLSLLADHFANEFGVDLQFTPKAKDILYSYDWPGNVRELRNMIIKLSIMEVDQVDDQLLLKTFHQLNRQGAGVRPEQTDLAQSVSLKEKELIIDALNRTGMNLSAAARLLGISRSSLYGKIRRLGIEIGKEVKAPSGVGGSS